MDGVLFPDSEFSSLDPTAIANVSPFHILCRETKTKRNQQASVVLLMYYGALIFYRSLDYQTQNGLLIGVVGLQMK